MFLSLALLIACAADASLSGAKVDDTGAFTEADQAPAACELPADAAGLEGAEVLFAHGVAASDLGEDVRVVEDAAAWEAVRGAVDWGAEPPAAEVDFEDVRLVVLGAYVSSTCSLGVSGVQVYGGAAPHVVAVFEDRSGACEVTCEAEGAAVVVVAVPRGAGVPTACGERLDVCEGM
jgi:hypothetical protein